jgi:hypothetical protein
MTIHGGRMKMKAPHKSALRGKALKPSGRAGDERQMALNLPWTLPTSPMSNNTVLYPPQIVITAE